MTNDNILVDIQYFTADVCVRARDSAYVLVCYIPYTVYKKISLIFILFHSLWTVLTHVLSFSPTSCENPQKDALLLSIWWRRFSTQMKPSPSQLQRSTFNIIIQTFALIYLQMCVRISTSYESIYIPYLCNYS